MSKVRIYELSKELNIGSKTIIEKAKEFGVTVTNLSGVDADLADKLRGAFSADKPAKNEEPKTKNISDNAANQKVKRNTAENRNS